MKADPDRLVQGSVVQYEEKLWMVGLVNDSRARLDPLTGKQVKIPSADGKGSEFTTYDNSVNVSPTAMLRVVDSGTLDETMAERLERLTRQLKGERNMTATAEAGGNVAGVPVPAKTAKRKVAKPVKANGAAGKARVAKPPVAKSAKSAKTAKPAREKTNACKCGCGDKTGGHFVPGHDARFKGWMIKIERGLMSPDELKKSVREAYRWVKRGDGYMATTTYKGEPNKGYDA